MEFLPEDYQELGDCIAPGVPFESLDQKVLMANQNVSCFNLGPFPCVCFSLPVVWAVLGAWEVC